MMYYGNVTFVMALPRSRTAWIAETFDQGSATTMHDPLKDCASIEELAGKIDEASYGEYHYEPVIVVDTAIKFFYPQIAERFPGARYCFIDRPFLDVADSLRRAGQPVHGEVLAEAAAWLRRAQERARQDRQFTYRVHFSDLDYHATLHNMWRFFGILDEPPEGHFEHMIDQNVQVPFAEQQRQTDGLKVARLMATRHQGW